MHTIAILTAALIGLSSIATAEANSLGRPCTSAPESQWLSLDALKAKAEAQGYKVQKAKLKAACGEIYALDQMAPGLSCSSIPRPASSSERCSHDRST